MLSVQEIVRRAETNYTSGTTKLGKYVDWSMHETLETIDAYLNSKHKSGPKDSLGRDKPFFNIVTAAVNVWYRATDLDRKNIRVMPSSSDTVVLAFIVTVLLQRWMREARFGVFLNEWGRSLSRYGSSVVKFVEKDKKLFPSVVPWNRFIPDPIDFDAIPRIEKLYKTDDQLKNMATPNHPDYAGYDMGQVEALCTAVSTRKTLDNQNQDNQSNFIEIYEVHGNLPTYLLLDKMPDDVEQKDVRYSLQMHAVSFVKSEDGEEWEDLTLFKGKEKRDVYMKTDLIKEDGRTLAIGACEYLLEAQWMQNHTMKNVKDYLDLVSKVIIKTTDSNFQGKNVLSNIETGDILIHSANSDISTLQMQKSEISQFLDFGVQWRSMAQDLTSTPDALRGNTLPSGTPYSLAAYSGAQASSLFEIMTENKGLAIEDMVNEFVLPFLRKQMDNKDEIIALLDEDSIAEIDAMWVPREAIRQHNEKVKKDLIAGRIPSPYQADVMQGQVRQQLGSLGNKRVFKPDELDEKTWKTVLDDFFGEAKAVVEVTNENTDKQAILTTLSTLLQIVASNPAILQDPTAKMLFNRILTETGNISPIQITAPTSSAPAPIPAPSSAASPPVTALSAASQAPAPGA